MSLSPKQLQELDADYKELIAFHNKANEVIIASERLDKEQRLSGVAIIELRSALTHIMRAHGIVYGVVDEKIISEKTNIPAFDYCKKNIDKAKGHLYRAAYDAYDIIAINLSEKINEYLDSFSPQALYTVIPDAARNIAKPFKKAQALITVGKLEKDIGTLEIEKQFAEYETATFQLIDIVDELEDKMAELIEFDNDLKKKDKKHIAIAVIGIAIGTILALIGITIAIAK